MAEGRPDPRWLIVNPRRVVLTAEGAAKELLQHIGNLRGEARRNWKLAHRRMFDIGIPAGGPGRAFEEVRLSTEMIRRIAAWRPGPSDGVPGGNRVTVRARSALKPPCGATTLTTVCPVILSSCRAI